MAKQTFDVIIIGGGVIGSSIAYNLAADGFDGRIAVFEKDRAYEFTSTPRSAGGMRAQFSAEANIEIAHYSQKFYEEFDERMAVGGEPAHIEFKQKGYLFLATEKDLPSMEKHHKLLHRLGVEVEVLSPRSISELVPHINLEGLAGASFGRRDGYLDAYGVLQGFAKKAKSLGVEYLYEEVTSIDVSNGQVTGIGAEKQNRYGAPIVVNAAGPYAAEVGKMAGVSLPVAPLRIMAFVFDPAVKFDYDLPMVIDPSGLCFRHEPGKQILATNGNPNESFGVNFSWDKDFFMNEIWPAIARRMPVFESLKLIRGWAGLLAFNRWDQNTLLGEHPEVKGFYVANGFSGHGLMQAPGVGKSLSEWIRLGRVETLDATPLHVERLLKGVKVVEEFLPGFPAESEGPVWGTE